MGCAKSRVKEKVQVKANPKIEEKLKKIGPLVERAGGVVWEAEEKVRIVNDLLYRAYSMAVEYRMGKAQQGLEHIKKCFNLLNNVLQKNYVAVDTEQMDEKIQEGLDALKEFLEEHSLSILQQATKKMEEAKGPAVKHVLKKMRTAEECIERPIRLIAFLKTFFKVSFKVHRILGENEPDMIEQAKEELTTVFEEFRIIHDSIFPPTKAQKMAANANKKRDQLRMIRVKMQKIYHYVEQMARKLRDSGKKIGDMGEAMQVSLPQLIKILFGGIVINLEGSSDLNILLDNSIFYVENSLIGVMENLASGDYENILDITEHTFEHKIVEDVELIIGWVFPAMYKEFKYEDIERYRKVLKVQSWYEKLNALLGDTRDLLEQSVDQFVSLSKHLEKGNNLGKVCTKLKICQTMTKEVIENMGSCSPVMKILPKLCRYILTGKDNKRIGKLREEAIGEMKKEEEIKAEERKEKEEEEEKKKSKKQKLKDKIKGKDEERRINFEDEEEVKEYLAGEVKKLAKSFSELTNTYKEAALQVLHALTDIDLMEANAQNKQKEHQEKLDKNPQKAEKQKLKDEEAEKKKANKMNDLKQKLGVKKGEGEEEEDDGEEKANKAHDLKMKLDEVKSENKEKSEKIKGKEEEAKHGKANKMHDLKQKLKGEGEEEDDDIY